MKDRLAIKLEAVAERKKQMELYEKALKEKFDEETSKEAGLYGDRPVVPKPGTRTNNGQQTNNTQQEVQIVTDEQQQLVTQQQQEKRLSALDSLPEALKDTHPLNMSLRQLKEAGIPFDTVPDTGELPDEEQDGN